jgi:ABC-2 type transport system permease protein
MHRALARTAAILERELRRFRRSWLLIAFTMIGPLLQLVVLGYAFGGTLHGLRVAVVDQDHGAAAVRLHALAGAVAAGPRTFTTLPYAGEAAALADLHAGRVDGVLTIPPGFSRRVLTRDDPQVGFVENNTDRFVSGTLAAVLGDLLAALGAGRAGPGRLGVVSRPLDTAPRLAVVELFPYVPYIQYLLPGTIVLAIFTMVMLGGAFSFIDDKLLGIHEGYLVTPVTKLELVAGFNLSGAVKAISAGSVLTAVGMVVAGIPHPLAPLRLLELEVVIALTALALVSVMFMLLARVSNPMIPRIASMLLNTLLFFPSGAVYPIQAFPAWMRAISVVDPFTYAVHALRSLLLTDAGLAAVLPDLAVLAGFAVVAMGLAAITFRRTL